MPKCIKVHDFQSKVLQSRLTFTCNFIALGAAEIREKRLARYAQFNGSLSPPASETSSQTGSDVAVQEQAATVNVSEVSGEKQKENVSAVENTNVVDESTKKKGQPTMAELAAERRARQAERNGAAPAKATDTNAAAEQTEGVSAESKKLTDADRSDVLRRVTYGESRATAELLGRLFEPAPTAAAASDTSSGEDAVDNAAVATANQMDDGLLDGPPPGCLDSLETPPEPPSQDDIAEIGQETAAEEVVTPTAQRTSYRDQMAERAERFRAQRKAEDDARKAEEAALAKKEAQKRAVEDQKKALAERAQKFAEQDRLRREREENDAKQEDDTDVSSVSNGAAAATEQVVMDDEEQLHPDDPRSRKMLLKPTKLLRNSWFSAKKCSKSSFFFVGNSKIPF